MNARQITELSFYEMVTAKYLLTLVATETTLCSTMVNFAGKSIAWPLAIALFCITAASASASAAEQQRSAGATAASDAAGGWDLALTGGFVATGLVDPVYALGSVAGQPSRVVLRQPDKESSVNLGIAMFAHVYNDRHAWVAPLSFGIGVRGDARATFYLGSALRFGSHAAFTAGWAIGTVATLPAGVVEGRPVTDTNFLTDLGTRTTSSWFTGVTYTFASLR
jgi:hypothetical protein